MDCQFKGFDRAGGRGNICTINDSITLHAVLDGIDVKFVRMGDCPLVPVVHCKDCKFYWKNMKDNIDEPVPACLASPKIDAFCSEGERKDDE